MHVMCVYIYPKYTTMKGDLQQEHRHTKATNTMVRELQQAQTTHKKTHNTHIKYTMEREL